MSPVWVKLGDFGVSKRILAQATTTLHTPVSTQFYSAPEVLGLDSNSETSNYTNSVDIWSLGCVVYELLVGTKLFVSEGQVSRYFFGKWPFPEDKLKGLSPPMDDIGILLLKSMLLIQPEHRPTAAGALSHGWLAGLKSDDKGSGDDQDETAPSLGEDDLCWRGGKQLATCGVPKKRRSDRNSVTQGNTKCTLGELVSGTNAQSQSSGHATTSNAIIDDSVITLLDVTSTESSLPQIGPLKPELMLYNLQITGSAGTKMLRRQQICTIPQSCVRSSTPNIKPKLHVKGVANESWMVNSRPPTSNPPTADRHCGSGFQSIHGTDNELEHSPKKIHQAPAPIIDETSSRVTHRRTYYTRQGRSGYGSSENAKDETLRHAGPDTSGGGDDGRYNGSAIISMRNPKTRGSGSARPDLHAWQTLITSGGADRNPNILRNPNRNPNTGRNPNRNPDAGWNPRAGRN